MKVVTKILIGTFIIVLILIYVVLNGIFLNYHEWRSNDLRNNYVYTVQITGLEGQIVNETTKIVVPIPANINGSFVSVPAQKEPTLSQKFVHEYVLHTPLEYRKGPYFKNTTEAFDYRAIEGNWTSYVINTEEGFMLCFQTNESVLENIYLRDQIVVDHVNGLNPLDKSNPILFPASNFSDAENISFEDMGIYHLEPAYTYDSFINTSNNLNKKELHFSVNLDVKERISKGSNEYKIKLLTDINNSGKTIVNVIISEPISKIAPS